MNSRLGMKYDLKNIVDMLRYFLPTPPVPVRWRRRLLAFGSGDPTRAICSTLIAEAFENIRCPILPEITKVPGHTAAASTYSREEILHIRLYAARFRPLALLRHRQADARVRFRLQAASLGG
jgi:hypothetical protein